MQCNQKYSQKAPQKYTLLEAKRNAIINYMPATGSWHKYPENKNVEIYDIYSTLFLVQLSWPVGALNNHHVGGLSREREHAEYASL